MGKALRDFIPSALYLGRDQLDVTDEGSVFATFQKYLPHTVIHLAAITDHQCPDIPALIETNIVGTQYVAKYSEQFGARLIYLSTHYVYPGERGNYYEGDREKPIGNYAWTKFAGEQALNRMHGSLIIRGSWYTKEKLELWKRKGALADAHTNREPIASAAEKIARLIRSNVQGIVNIGGKRRTFWKIVRDEGYEAEPIKRAQLKLPYDFPADSSVSTEKYEKLVQAA